MEQKRRKRNRTSTLIQFNDLNLDLTTNTTEHELTQTPKWIDKISDFNSDVWEESTANRVPVTQFIPIPFPLSPISKPNRTMSTSFFIGGDPDSELLQAVRSNNHEKWQYLLKGASASRQLADGMNCLHIACEEGHRKTVETILDYSIGIDVNERTEEGTTALHLACKAGNFGTIRLLIRSNADINALDKLGNTPAHYLAKTEYRDVVQWLTERKPNLSIRNSDGKQAWQYASNARIADLLRPIGLNRPSLEDYTILGQIGQGSFAKVYLASSRGEKFAIKAINKSKIAQKKAFRYIFTERKITTTTRHPFIVSATKAFQNTEYLFLVLPYYPHGDLAELLKQYRRFKEEKAILWFAQVVCAIEYLHANGIVHRDIKLSNVVIDSDGFCKLIDFGLSRYGITKTTIMESVLGTVAYLPPEMVAETGHNFLVDSYNLGTMLYEMLCGQPPFWAYERKQLLENIKSQELTFPQYVSPVAQNLLCKLLNRDQTKRLTIQGIKEHPFLSGINWADILAQRFTPPSTKPFVNKFKKVEPPKFSNTCDRTYYIQKWDYF